MLLHLVLLRSGQDNVLMMSRKLFSSIVLLLKSLHSFTWYNLEEEFFLYLYHVHCSWDVAEVDWTASCVLAMAKQLFLLIKWKSWMTECFEVIRPIYYYTITNFLYNNRLRSVTKGKSPLMEHTCHLIWDSLRQLYPWCCLLNKLGYYSLLLILQNNISWFHLIYAFLNSA